MVEATAYTGGPAFPSRVEGMSSANGMTLRDYFAAQFVIGAIQYGYMDHNTIPRRAYRMADEMLREREVKVER